MSVVANVAINVDSSGAVSKLRSVQNQAELTEKAFGGITAAATKLALAFGLLEGAKFVFAKTAELEAQSRSLQVLTGSAEKAGQIIKELQKLGAVTPFTSSELIDSAKRLQAFGVSTEKVVATTSRLADAAGATGAELSGLVTAYGQVQAKGRLQGEELLQFQERGIGLQGELNKMYGDKFQDALKKGQISAEAVEVALIRLTQTGGKYAGGAIAQSDTLAGLMSTLQDSVDELARRFGTELSQSIKNVTKFLIGFVEGIAAIPQPVMEATGKVVLFIAQLVLVEKAIKAIIGLNAAFVAAQVSMAGATAASGAAATTSAGAFALYTNNAKTLQATSIAAAGSVSGLSAALLSLAGIGIITVGINYVITQTGAILGSSTAAGKSEAAGTAGGLAAQLKGKSAAERKQMLAAAQKNLANDKKLASTLSLQIKAQESAMTMPGEGPLPSDRSKLTELQARINTNQARIKAIQTTPIERATPTKRTPATPDLLGGKTTGTGTGKGAGKGENDAERKAEEKRRAAEELANLQGQVTLKEKLFGIDKQIAVEKQRGSLVTAAALEMDKALEERQARIAEITRSTADTATKNAQIKDATLDADQKIFAVQQDIKEKEVERTKSFDAIIADLNLELALKTATTEQAREQLRLEAEIAKLKGQGFTPEQIGAITAKKTELAAPKTDQQNITEKIGKLKDEIADLTSISNIAITSAEGIGNAFAQSFQGLISGSMTAKEALGSFFKSVADMFLEMAAQIIAKQITMIILQTILKALGAVGGGGGGFTASGAGFGGTNSFGSFDAGGAAAFGGGMSFAGGGYTGNAPRVGGIDGQGGFPAILHPQETVVDHSGLRSAMGRPPGGANGSTVLNMSFQSTSINGVEYVSRDQLEQAMAQTRRDASRDGAKRGMTMTLDKLQQSPSTRSRVGMR